MQPSAQVVCVSGSRTSRKGRQCTARVLTISGHIFVIPAANAAGVWECPEADQTTWLDPASGNYVGQCVGIGNWVEHNPEFDPSTLDPAVIASALAGGFVTMGFGCLLALAVRTIVNAVRSS